MSAIGDASARGERAQSGNPAVRWWTRWRAERRALRREIAWAVCDLRERHGAGARAVALNAARQPVGVVGRRFWRRVARQLKRLG